MRGKDGKLFKRRRISFRMAELDEYEQQVRKACRIVNDSFLRMHILRSLEITPRKISEIISYLQQDPRITPLLVQKENAQGRMYFKAQTMHKTYGMSYQSVRVHCEEMAKEGIIFKDKAVSNARKKFRADGMEVPNPGVVHYSLTRLGVDVLQRLTK